MGGVGAVQTAWEPRVLSIRGSWSGVGANNIKEIVTHRLFAASMAWTNSLDPAPHFVKTLSAVVNGTSTAVHSFGR